MTGRRSWTGRAAATAAATAALVALAAPAGAAAAAAAPAGTTASATASATAPAPSAPSGTGAAATTATTATTASAASAAFAVAADVDYATWQRDCRAVMDQALPYVKERIAHPRPGEKQAIVLDVDNTALETDFGFSFPQPANRPVLDVARYAQEHGVDLFFVTARPGILYLPTEWNLDHRGYEVGGLRVRGFLDLFKNVADYKTAQRVSIEKQGYTIIANIGNSATDLSGGHAEKTFKLPDYGGRLS